MTTLDISFKMACLAMTPVKNLRVLLHTDNADDKHGYVVMTSSGKFMGGHLLVDSWTIQYRMKYQLCNVAVFNSGILPCVITPFKEKRQAVVLFSIRKPSYTKVFQFRTSDVE
jgi:hypothetical protein